MILTRDKNKFDATYHHKMVKSIIVAVTMVDTDSPQRKAIASGSFADEDGRLEGSGDGSEAPGWRSGPRTGA